MLERKKESKQASEIDRKKVNNERREGSKERREDGGKAAGTMKQKSGNQWKARGGRLGEEEKKERSKEFCSMEKTSDNRAIFLVCIQAQINHHLATC